MDLEICKLSYEGRGEAVVELVSRQPAAISQKDSSGRMAIHWAASGGHWSICDWLVTKGKSLVFLSLSVFVICHYLL